MSKEKSRKQDYDLENNIGFLISDAHRMVTSVIDNVMSPLGLTRSQLRVLLFLMRKDGYTQVELAEQLEIGKVAMGGLLDRLEEKKLIKRIPHPTDKRARHVYLSKQIESLYSPMEELGSGLMEQLFKGISKTQQQAMIHNLKTLKQNCKDILNE